MIIFYKDNKGVWHTETSLEGVVNRLRYKRNLFNLRARNSAETPNNSKKRKFSWTFKLKGNKMSKLNPKTLTTIKKIATEVARAAAGTILTLAALYAQGRGWKCPVEKDDTSPVKTKEEKKSPLVINETEEEIIE